MDIWASRTSRWVRDTDQNDTDYLAVMAGGEDNDGYTDLEEFISLVDVQN